VQHLRARSAAEQVHPAPAKLPGARTREEEAHPVGFDDAVHLVEQERQSLDLVDGDDLDVRRELLDEPARILAEIEEDGIVQKVIDARLR
jgi:hypothetical protein